MIFLVQRSFMILALGCCVYVVLFFLSKSKEDFFSGSNSVVDKSLVLPPLTLDLKPYAPLQARDVFFPASSADNVENTLKGQLPANLKIVGVLIAHPSQIIIEDTLIHKTYFIDEGNPQAGIKIVQVGHDGHDRMVINYQGQDIYVPINDY